MKKILFLILLIISCTLSYAETIKTTKKYPPYPDIWLFELPLREIYKNRDCAKMIKMDNGDYLLMYSKNNGILLFEQKEIELNEEEYNKYCNERRNEVKFVFNSRFILNDGRKIHYFYAHPRCYEVFKNKISVETKKDKERWRYFSILSVLDEPRKIYDFNKYCEGTCDLEQDYILERFKSARTDFIKLDDDTFLAFLFFGRDDPDTRYIVRFDEDMNTKANIFNKDKFYIINIKDFYEQKTLHMPKQDVQAKIDFMMQYIQLFKKRSE